MKNFTKIGSASAARLIKLSAFFSFLILISCQKESVTDDTNPYISVMNVSPTTGTYNIYLNDSKITAGAVAFGGFVGYMQFTAGDITAKFTTASSIDPVLTKTFPLELNKTYSLFLIDKDENRDAFLVNDVFPEVAAEKAYVRFINLSSDAPVLDLSVSGSNDIAGHKAYKEASEFVEISPGTYTFDISDNATGALKTTLSSQMLAAGRVYTIIARGLLNATTEPDQTFGSQMVTNY